MEIAALAISVVALLAAGWSAWGTHRQARATEEQARAACAANATAVEALALAAAADSREQARQHVEERPDFKVGGKRAKHKPLLTTVTVKNEGPLSYESVTVRPDMEDAETKRIVRGIDQSATLADEATLGPMQPGETITTALVRTGSQNGGQAKLYVTARRGENKWTTIHYVPVSRPPRVIVPS